MFTLDETPNIKKIDFSYFKERHLLELEYLEKYLENNNQNIEGQKQKLGEDLFKKIENEPEKESYYNDFYENDFQILISFYYHSSITLIHSTLENTLNQLCEEIRIKTNNSFSIANIKNRDLISQATDYIQFTSKLDFKVIEKEIPDIKKYQKLRNKIIHQNSCYNSQKEKDEIEKMFPNKVSFEMNNNRFHISDFKVVSNHLKKVRMLMLNIISHIEKQEFKINNPV